MNKSSEKIILRREQEVYKKLKENADLIYDLNEMRKLNKDLQTDQTNKKIQIDNLQKQNASILMEINKYKRQLGTDHPPTKVQNFGINEGERPQTQEKQQRPTTSAMGNFPRPQSMRIQQRMGKVIKGPNFDSKTLNTFDKAKMMDMMAEMELSANRLISQEVLIKDIRNKIRRHVMDRSCCGGGCLRMDEDVINEKIIDALPVVRSSKNVV